ncbi:MAG: hypothetical protein HYZ16_02220 [Bacteroidetes bacterium]|jgi:hypothetical protein|nr:hypothetical protein [Bacteroidota bacterium]
MKEQDVLHMDDHDILQKNNGVHDARVWVFAALALFVAAAILGLLMRSYPLFDIAWPYRHLIHAHSHTALLGFGFTAAAGLLARQFLDNYLKGNSLKWILAINVLASVGMFIAFSVQGYGAVSIAFSTLHLVAAYWFCAFFLLKAKKNGQALGYSIAKSAVLWQFVSTVGIWTLAPVSVRLGQSHWLYEGSIQFFLYFQFNGWLGMAAMALLVSCLPRSSSRFWSVGLLNIGMPFGYFLNLYWVFGRGWMLAVYALGMSLQLVGMVWLLRGPKAGIVYVGDHGWAYRLLLLGALFSLAMRALFQLLASMPWIAQAVGQGRNLVIGHIHLSMIGGVGMALVAVALAQGMLRPGRAMAWGSALLIVGFVITEAVLFGQTWFIKAGVGFQKGMDLMLFAASMLFPLGIGGLAYSAWPHRGPKGRPA